MIIDRQERKNLILAVTLGKFASRKLNGDYDLDIFENALRTVVKVDKLPEVSDDMKAYAKPLIDALRSFVFKGEFYDLAQCEQNARDVLEKYWD